MYLCNKFLCISKIINIKINIVFIFLDGIGIVGYLFLGWDYLKMEGRVRLDLFILNYLKIKEEKRVFIFKLKNYS